MKHNLPYEEGKNAYYEYGDDPILVKNLYKIGSSESESWKNGFEDALWEATTDGDF